MDNTSTLGRGAGEVDLLGLRVEVEEEIPLGKPAAVDNGRVHDGGDHIGVFSTLRISARRGSRAG